LSMLAGDSSAASGASIIAGSSSTCIGGSF
jgi:hypothetical protein